MDAIVLAGGKGTRLRSLVNDRPKPMASVAGKPFLEHILLNLYNYQFTRVLLSVGYLADQISHYFGDNFKGMEISYVLEDEPLGTGGAILKAFNEVGSDSAVVLNGDTYADIDYYGLIARWNRNEKGIICVKRGVSEGRYGSIYVEDNRVVDPKSGGSYGEYYINIGCYILSKKIFDNFNNNEAFSFEKHFLEDFVGLYNFIAHEVNGDFIDIGVPEDYIRSQKLF